MSLVEPTKKDSRIAKMVERRLSVISDKQSVKTRESRTKSPVVAHKSERGSTQSLERRLGYTPNADTYLNRVRNSSRGKRSNDSRQIRMCLKSPEPEIRISRLAFTNNKEVKAKRNVASQTLKYASAIVLNLPDDMIRAVKVQLQR